MSVVIFTLNSSRNVDLLLWFSGCEDIKYKKLGHTQYLQYYDCFSIELYFILSHSNLLFKKKFVHDVQS